MDVTKFLPVGKIGNEIYFAWVQEDLLLGARKSDKTIAHLCHVKMFKPEDFPYRLSTRVPPYQFIKILGRLGYQKEKLVFSLHPNHEIPERFEQVLNPSLLRAVKSATEKSPFPGGINVRRKKG